MRNLLSGTIPVTAATASTIAEELARLAPAQTTYATQFVELLLAAARSRNASDVHLHPLPEGLEIRWRMDGVLQPVGTFPRGGATDVVAKLKVLAGLLTYRTDLPQEGRIGNHSLEQPERVTAENVEMRVSTFPTLYGERAVVRLFAGQGRYLFPEELGLPSDVQAALLKILSETSGAVLMTGPAGSGKTTSAYAALRHLARQSQGMKSLVSLEDPIEVAVAGVSQSQINPAAGFDYATGLRSLMRQDPEVILVGEIRDKPTAETAFQAALTGHLVLSTFHAANAAGALSRLADMGIEPYLLRSGLRGVINQRLLRRLCSCAIPADQEQQKLGLPVAGAKVAQGCEKCLQTGYSGRIVLAELLPPLEGELGTAVLERRDSRALQTAALSAGMASLLQSACHLVESSQTDAPEVRRVLGFEAQ